MTTSFYYPTLKDIRSRVRFYIDEPIQANFTDIDLNYAINDAQQTVANELAQVDEKWFVGTTPQTISVLANTQFYTLPADFNKMAFMYDSLTGIPIPFTDLIAQSTVIPTVVPNVNYGGSGFNAIIVGQSVGFTPIPTTNNNFSPVYYYVPNVPDLIADTDTTIIPRNYVDLLAIQAAIDAKVKDEDDTSALERKYSTRMNQLISSARNRQQQNPKHVQRVDGLSNLTGFF